MTNYGFRDSFQKFFDIISFTSTQPLDWSVQYQGKRYRFSSIGVSKLELGNSFYRDDKCLACGKCCSSLGFFLFLTESDFNVNPRKEKFREVKVGGLSIFTLQFTVEVKCPFFMNSLCAIQNNKPIHCQFPHIKVRQVGNKGLLYKAPYSRRWAKPEESRCPIDSFEEYTEGGRQSDIKVLNHLVRVQEDLSIDSSLARGVVNKLERKEVCRLAQLTLL